MLADEYRIAGTVLAPAAGVSWDPSCEMGLLRPTMKPNIFSVRLANIPAGRYEYKVPNFAPDSSVPEGMVP
jgi:hypothetical protein